MFLLLLSVTACKDTDELPDETPTVPDTDIAVVQDTAVKPTGISVQEGDEIMVLVGDTHGQQISLQSIWESGEEYRQTNVSGDIYFLRPGVNKLTMRNQGQLFVMYNTDLTAPEAQPVKIHILPGSGTVTGFFDLKEHQTDEKYAELLSKATHQGEDTEIHMRMNWQLWNYYHRCGHKKDFWQTLFRLLRADRIVESDPGAAQLKFAMRASEAAGEDLTGFFDLWGFFIPGEDTIPEGVDLTGTGLFAVQADGKRIEVPRQK